MGWKDTITETPSLQASGWRSTIKETSPQKSTAVDVLETIGEFGEGAISGLGKVGSGIIQRASEMGGDATGAIARTILPVIRPDLADELKGITSEDVRKSAGSAGSIEQETTAGKIGAFVGEVAPLLGIPNVGLLKTGAIAGAASGFLQPTQSKEEVAGNTLGGAGLGAVTGGAFNAAGRALPVVAKAITSATPTKMLGGLANAKNINADVVRAAEAEGIKMPPSAITNNRIIQFLESRVAQSGLSGKSYDTLISNLNDDFIKSYTGTLDDVSKSAFANPTEAGDAVQKALKFKQDASQTLVRQKYGSLLEKHGEEAVDPKTTLRYIDATMKKLGNTASASSSKTTVLTKLSEIKSSLLEGGATTEKLLNTKNDLSEIINFETQGGVKQFLKGAVTTINNDIRATANPEMVKMFNQAEGLAKANAQTFRNNIVKSMLKNERPELVLNSINNPSDVAKLEAALGNSPKMKEIGQSVKRMKLEQILANTTEMAGETGAQSVKFGTFSTALTDNNKTNPLIRALAGDQQFKRLENLRKIAGGVASGRRFFNFSKTANVATDVAALLNGFSGFMGNPAAVLSATPWALAKVITSPKLTNAMTRSLRAQQVAKPKLIEKFNGQLMLELEKEGLIAGVSGYQGNKPLMIESK